MKESEGDADITIFSSQSEVWVSLDVEKLLSQYQIRVVNMLVGNYLKNNLKNIKIKL